ncbi:hypothetical protein HK405_015560, partial [Cladochytrium tenue]
QRTRTWVGDALVDTVSDHERRCRRRLAAVLFECALVSRAWAAAAIPTLWAAPVLASDATAVAIRDILEEAAPPGGRDFTSGQRPLPFSLPGMVRALYMEDLTASAALPLLRLLLPGGRIELVHFSGLQGAALALTYAIFVRILSVSGFSAVREIRIGSMFDYVGELGAVRALEASAPMGPLGGARVFDLGSVRWDGDSTVRTVASALVESSPRPLSIDIGASIHSLSGGLMDARVTSVGIEFLAETLGTRLVRLSVAGVGITAGTIEKLAHHCGVSLKHLNLSGCDGITDEALNTLADKCLELEALDLSGYASLRITEMG